MTATPSQGPPDGRPPRKPIGQRKAQLRKTAAGQYGLFTVADAAAADIGPSTITAMVRSGEALRLGRGVQRFSGHPQDFHTNVLTKILQIGRGAVASHSLALRLHGVTLATVPVRDEFSVRDTTARGKGLDVVVHRTSDLRPIDALLIEGIPTTTGARTAVDLAPRLDVWQRAQLLDALIGKRVTSRTRVHKCASALANGRKGAASLVAMTRPGAEAWFRSWLERAFRDLLQRFALPAARWNVRLVDCPLAGEVDCLLPEHRVVIELDGLRFHEDRRVRILDDAKGNALALGRYLPLRFTWEDVVWRPLEVARQVAQATGRRLPTQVVPWIPPALELTQSPF